MSIFYSKTSLFGNLGYLFFYNLFHNDIPGLLDKKLPRLNITLPALNLTAYGTVIFISHPAGEPIALGRMTGGVTKTHCLDPAVKTHTISHLNLYTVKSEHYKLGQPPAR